MQKQRKTRFILYFPSADDVQHLPGKQDFSTCSGCSEISNAPHPSAPSSFLSAFVAEQMSYGIEHS